MQHFYQNLAAHPNQTKAESLHQAQLRLMKTSRPTLLEQFGRSLSDPTKRSMADIAKNKPKSTSNKTPDYSHPYYWAAFTLIGNSL
jgi:CHAT domain-containing protein